MPIHRKWRHRFTCIHSISNPLLDLQKECERDRSCDKSQESKAKMGGADVATETERTQHEKERVPGEVKEITGLHPTE